ncbi:MAG TPA: hypothetical protein VFW28_08475 [Micropepsaceae bacterium]|nr:hypothetical protein [Micropepsaceae bacterium]
MFNKAERAARYRNRAEEMRAVAEAMASRQARDVLLKIADDYDEMAAGYETMSRCRLS